MDDFRGLLTARQLQRAADANKVLFPFHPRSDKRWLPCDG
jgi:hypothetical protein